MVANDDDDDVVSTKNAKLIQSAKKNLLNGLDSVPLVENVFGGLNNDLELCVISLLPDIPLSSLNNINVTYDSVEKRSLEIGNGNQLPMHVSCKNVNFVQNQPVLMKTINDNTMVINNRQYSIDFTEFVPVTLPDLNNCIPRPPPPIMPDVKVRFKPFGWQDPTDEQSPIKLRKMMPKKKHKRKIEFDFNCSTPAGDHHNSFSSAYPLEKKKKKKDKAFQFKESLSPTSHNSTCSMNVSVENDGLLPTITSKEPVKKKRKKENKEHSIYFPLSQTDPVLPTDSDNTVLSSSPKDKHESSIIEDDDNVVSHFSKVVVKLEKVDMGNIQGKDNVQANISKPLLRKIPKKKKKSKSSKTEGRDDDINYPSLPEVVPKSTIHNSQVSTSNAKREKRKKKKHKEEKLISEYFPESILYDKPDITATSVKHPTKQKKRQEK